MLTLQPHVKSQEAAESLRAVVGMVIKFMIGFDQA
jgi:hypothetical protein